MEMPSIKINDIIRIGDGFDSPKAQIVTLYTEDDKKTGLFGDVEVVYWQNKVKGIKEDVIWNGKTWEFKNKGPSGVYVNIDLYPELKK